MPQNGGGFGVGDFIELNLRTLVDFGDGLWAKNIIKLTESITINGIDYLVEQKLPFELLIIRTSSPPPTGVFSTLEVQTMDIKKCRVSAHKQGRLPAS